MSRVPRVIVDPKNPQSIVEHLSRVQQVVDGKLEFGSPQDPRDPQSTAIADGAAHNGTLANIDGSWVTQKITAPGRSDITCVHNLFDAATFTPTAGLVPVRWFVWGWGHDGTGGSGATQLSISVWYMGGAITASSIVLAVDVTKTGGALTIDASHPVRVDLFFIRAVR